MLLMSRMVHTKFTEETLRHSYAFISSELRQRSLRDLLEATWAFLPLVRLSSSTAMFTNV
eukprot:4298425-Pleurochrysis_carterae.AAC.2